MKNVSETLKSACYFEMLCGGDRDVVTLMIVFQNLSARPWKPSLWAQSWWRRSWSLIWMFCLPSY